MIRRISYFLRKARESMWRTPLLTAATVTMLAVIFLLFFGFALVAYNISSMAEKWTGQVRMTVFLTDDFTPADAQVLSSKLRERSEVTTALYITREEARTRFLKDFPGGESIFDGLSEYPLPASLELELTPESMTVDRLETLSAFIRSRDGVEDVLFGKELFSKLTALVGLLRLIGLFFGIALMVAVVFLTANTIRLNLYGRREEIQIMQLVGATRWFIRLPFMIEGTLQGMFGSAFAAFFTWGLFALASEPISEAMSGSLGFGTISFLPLSFVFFAIVGGATLGAVGSFIALGRFSPEQ